MNNDEKDKGYKVIDRRSGEASSEAPPVGQTPLVGEAAGNPKDAAGVQGEKRDAGTAAGKPGPPGFLDLVESLQMGVMANLGMLQRSDGKRTPVNLVEAQNIIDILGILQEKTKGNLDENEEKVLREGLYHLRMAFLAVQKQTIPDLGGGR
jgi:hypothetical protein